MSRLQTVNQNPFMTQKKVQIQVQMFRNVKNVIQLCSLDQFMSFVLMFTIMQYCKLQVLCASHL